MGGSSHARFFLFIDHGIHVNLGSMLLFRQSHHHTVDNGWMMMMIAIRVALVKTYYIWEPLQHESIAIPRKDNGGLGGAQKQRHCSDPKQHIAL
jgi:hypothetical protein